MSFPETRHTFIQRLAAHGGEDDWRRFMDEYWFPVCRFAARSAQLKTDEAEDVASITFAALLQNKLLSRWVNNPTARLRTLLCSVVRNVLSNQARVESGRAALRKRDRHLLEAVGSIHLDAAASVSPEELSEFYSAWVDELLHGAIERLLEHYHTSSRGDHFRVLYGRVCEQLTNREVARHLELKVSTVENYYKDARNRLGMQLRAELKQRVERYARPDTVESEFQAEWSELSKYLEGRGGLENAIRAAHEQFSAGDVSRRKQLSITAFLTDISIPPAPDSPND